MMGLKVLDNIDERLGGGDHIVTKEDRIDDMAQVALIQLVNQPSDLRLANVITRFGRRPV